MWRSKDSVSKRITCQMNRCKTRKAIELEKEIGREYGALLTTAISQKGGGSSISTKKKGWI